MSTIKGVKVLLAVLCILFFAFVIYGFVTDCPNTAGYFFCSDSERRFLQQ
ncbi:MAG: hypothetical protein Q7T48_17960 [Cellvibrio sp.]|nr:hypothetical protein [Cellvibrio sp.]